MPRGIEGGRAFFDSIKAPKKPMPEFKPKPTEVVGRFRKGVGAHHVVDIPPEEHQKFVEVARKNSWKTSDEAMKQQVDLDATGVDSVDEVNLTQNTHSGGNKIGVRKDVKQRTGYDIVGGRKWKDGKHPPHQPKYKDHK